jgi:tetratricopeptide (TPR) repeat protein
MRILFVSLLTTVLLAFQPDTALLRRVYEDQVARCEREFGPGDPRTAQAARDLAFFLKGAGKDKDAAAAFSKALRIDQANLGADARQSLAGLIALASVSPPVEAETLLRRALASPSMNSQLAVPALSTLGDLRFAAGDRKGAAASWRLAIQHAELVNGKESDAVAKILYSLSRIVDANEAVDLLARAKNIALQTWGERHPETATCEINLANALLKAGRKAEAAEQARQGLASFEASLGPRHPRVAVALTTLAEVMRAQGNAREAVALYRRALEIDTQSLGEKDPQTLSDASSLTALLRATRK